ncbi:MAG: polysaccharide deacetylase family protein [Magnetospirillum sp.]|nr:MAG: polysaccharide deacetylase family protein [Magnetospirillum sp.]
MSLREALAAPALGLWRLARWLRPERDGGFRILLFHDIPCSQRQAFGRLVGGLAAGNRLIDPAEAERRLGGGSGPPGVLLSFDDGFASNLTVAEEILAPLGVRALFFVCPGLMELAAEAQRAAIATNVLRGRRTAPEGLMDWAAVERLQAEGHVIGSHTLDHLRLTELSPDQRAEQIGGSAEALTRRLGRPAEWFAYTFGDVDSIDAAALAEIGRRHRFCRSGVRGGNGPETPPLALRADHVDLAAGPAWQALAADGGLDVRYRAQRRRLDGMAAGV